MKTFFNLLFRAFSTVLILCVLLTGVAVAAERFTLVSIDSDTTAGPYTLFGGAKVRIAGELFELRIGNDERVTFVSVGSQKRYGPFQPVDGRIMRIADVSYVFRSVGEAERKKVNSGARSSSAVSGATPALDPTAPIATFDPLPPPPERIAIPAEDPRRTVAPLDFPALPDATSPLAWQFWLAPIDSTPLKWKIEGDAGNKTDLERVSLGGAITWNAWLAEVQVSMNEKSGRIVPDGLALSDCSLDGGSGFAFAVGYQRPFVVDGPWVASAGLYGRIRREEADLSVNLLHETSMIDTNIVGNVVYASDIGSSTIKISETSLRLNLQLAYETEIWSAMAGVIVQPICEVEVSGDIPNGNSTLSLSAEHDEPLGVRLGVTANAADMFEIFGDITLGLERYVRVGIRREF